MVTEIGCISVVFVEYFLFIQVFARYVSFPRFHIL